MRKYIFLSLSQMHSFVGKLYLTLIFSIIISTNEVMLAFRPRLNTVLCQFSANCGIIHGKISHLLGLNNNLSFIYF